MLRASQATCKTDTGRQRRENEDSAFVRSPLFVVADGMGGAQAGEVASRIAVETFQRELPAGGTPEQRLADCAREANRRIYEISRTEHERAGMGTTLTAVYLGEADLSIAHVGDSRAYLFRERGLQRMTEDHSLVEELLRHGKLTEEQAAEHPQRSIITRALGIDPEVEIDTWTYPARAGDVVLLCSDGLTSMISEPQITAILRAEPDLDRAGELLIALANEAGGRDNITVVLFALEEAGGAPAAEPPTVVGLEPALGERATADGSRGPTSATMTAPAATPAAHTAAAVAPPAPAATPRWGAAPPRPQERPATVRRRGRPPRFAKPLAALLSALIVAGLLGAGGYLATRQLFFVGTDAQGIVTIYRGLPYNLPLGIHLYEQVYVSGVPVSLVPAARRAGLLDHRLRSQADAISLVHAAELGRLVR